MKPSPAAEIGDTASRGRPWLMTAIGLSALCLLFLVVDQAYVRMLDRRFPPVGSSVWLATAWGIASRLHWIALLVPFAVWRPRMLGLRVGTIRERWTMVIGLLAVNMGVVAAYLWLTGSSTPYSAGQWSVTEVVTVPVVEELVWRGLVFGALLAILTRHRPDRLGMHLAVWFTAIAFGLLHLGNVMVGLDAGFAVVQAANAVLWGAVYGYVRAGTGSVYPPILLHAAMNLVVVLF